MRGNLIEPLWETCRCWCSFVRAARPRSSRSFGVPQAVRRRQRCVCFEQEASTYPHLVGSRCVSCHHFLGVMFIPSFFYARVGAWTAISVRIIMSVLAGLFLGSLQKSQSHNSPCFPYAPARQRPAMQHSCSCGLLQLGVGWFWGIGLLVGTGLGQKVSRQLCM